MNEKILQEARQRLGLLFKDLRKQKKLSQIEVAKFCGVTFQTINKVEQGKFNYSVDLLMKISIVLGFTINFEIKKDTKSRFLLQKSNIDNFYTLTDEVNEIVCSFEKNKFNETQKFSFLNDTSFDVSRLATIMREFGDFLQNNHKDII